MKKPTFKEFAEEMRKIEKLEGERMKLDGELPAADPFTDEELLEMWKATQSEPPTGLDYGGEIRDLR